MTQYLLILVVQCLDWHLLAVCNQFAHQPVVFLAVRQNQKLVAGMIINQLAHAALSCQVIPPAFHGKNLEDKIFPD